MTDEERRARLGELAGEIEAEMRRLGVWNAAPPSEERVLEGGAFGMGTVAFEQWIQVVLLARLRQVAAGEIPIPASSSIGTQAAREWDTAGYDTARLQKLIHEVDTVAGRRG
jgi:uncharacterized protein YqcC (DUF446 family)